MMYWYGSWVGGIYCSGGRRVSVPIEYTLDSWIVEAWGSIPARIPRYRTSEWEIKEIGFPMKVCAIAGRLRGKGDRVSKICEIGRAHV